MKKWQVGQIKYIWPSFQWRHIDLLFLFGKKTKNFFFSSNLESFHSTRSTFQISKIQLSIYVCMSGQSSIHLTTHPTTHIILSESRCLSPSVCATLYSIKPKQRLGSVYFTVQVGPANWFQARSCCRVMEQANVMMKPGWSCWWLSQGPICLSDRRQGCVCPPVYSSIRHKGYGLSYRGDRWYVYRRMFAFCTVFYYRVCVCHRLWICAWEKDGVCLVVCVLQAMLRSHRPLSIKLFTHFLPYCRVFCLNKTPRVIQFLLFFSHSWEVVQSKSKPRRFTEFATLHK